MLISHKHGLLRRVIFPVFNLGVLFFEVGSALILVTIGFEISWTLAGLMAAFSHLFFVLNVFLLGLAPAEATIPDHYGTFIAAELDGSKRFIKVTPNSWARPQYASDLWASDRIGYVPAGPGLIRVSARYRDLRLLERVIANLDKTHDSRPR